MKQWILSGLFLIGLNFGSAQSDGADSLKQVLQTMPQDTNRILVLLQIGNYYESANLDSSERYYRKALQLSKDLNLPFYEGKTISWFTDVLNRKGEAEEALQLNLRALEVGRLLNHRRLTVASLANVANNYQYIGDFEKTLSYQLEALPLVEQMDNPVYLSSVLNNISGTYQLMRQHEKAKPYALRALQTAQASGDYFGEGSALLSLGVIHSRTGDRRKGIDYSLQALKLSEEQGLTQIQALALLNTGDNYKLMDEPLKALTFLERGIPIAEEVGDNETLARLLLSAGDVHFDLDRPQQAITFLKRSLDLSRQYGFRDVLKTVYLSMSDAEQHLGNWEQGAAYRREYHLLSDSLINETVLQATANLEARYKTAEKEKEIHQLQGLNEVQQLRLRQRQGIIVGLGTLLGLLGSVGFLYYQNTQNKQQLSLKEAQIREQKIRQLEQEKQLSAVDAMLRGQEAERSRLARDLHDGLGGMLSGVRQTITTMKGNQIITEGSALAFNRALEMLDTSISELRRVARNMMPEALMKFGLKDALQDYCDTLNEPGALKVQYQTFGLETRLPESTEVIVFRIVQELLNNVVKHAGASHVLVQLLQDNERFHLTVEDNGKGFDPVALEKAPGIGWLNIRSRVEYLGGTLDLRSKPGGGTSVEIEFSLDGRN